MTVSIETIEKSPCEFCETYSEECVYCVEWQTWRESSCRRCKSTTIEVFEFQLRREFKFVKCSVCRDEELLNRLCPACGVIGCGEIVCPASGLCECCGQAEEDCLFYRAADEEPYCGACQTGGCIGDCKTAAHLFSLQRGAESLSRMCSSRAEPLLEGDIDWWAHLATHQERLEKLEELEVELLSAPWDVDVSLSHVNSLRRDVESLSRVCGISAEPFLHGDARQWKHLATERERIEKLEELEAELQGANSGPETELPLLSDEEIKRRLAPYSAPAPV